MVHTCDDCDEKFETLTKLRLHDCPGPPLGGAEHARKIVDETGTLDRGDVLSTFPDEPVRVSTVEELEDAEGVLTVVPQMSGTPGTEETERIALQTTAGACVIEYFPGRGWVAVRTVRVGDRSEDQVYEELVEQIQDWQSVVREIALGHASGDVDGKQRLREELGF